MSASLVGSEMCIRDSRWVIPHRGSLATGGCKPIATRSAGSSAFTAASFPLTVPGDMRPRTSSVTAHLGWARRRQSARSGRTLAAPTQRTNAWPGLAWPGPGEWRRQARAPSPAELRHRQDCIAGPPP
eukprot:2761888-Alexandrium_andersonii.AAC.1